ncbi:MAG: hypothetical protein AB7F65_06505 [Dehalococcoidia bacterium]
MSVPPAIPATPMNARPALALAVARRAMPLVTASAGVALATLAAERAVASLALRAAERTGLRRTAHPTPAADGGIVRVTVTRTTVVERITTRR